MPKVLPSAQANTEGNSASMPLSGVFSALNGFAMDYLLRWRFTQQFAALFKKNALVAWRNRRATIVRLIAPFFFLLLALVIERAIKADTRSSEDVSEVTDPKPMPISPIPPCESDLYIGKRKCYDFLYTPDNNTLINGLVTNIRTKNPGRAIPNEKVMAFPDRIASDAYMLKNPETALAVIHFEVDANEVISFALQTNTSVKFFKGEFQDVNTFVEVPLMVAAQREIARHYLVKAGRQADADKLQVDVTIKNYPHPLLQTTAIVGQVLGPFIFAACMFSFVVQLSAVVIEKENGLKQALRTMGMLDSSYWLSWVAWEAVMAFTFAHLTIWFGMIMQFRMFLYNSYGLLFFLFFLFQMAMASFALFLACFVRKSSLSVYLGFLIFIVGWIIQVVVLFGIPYTPDYINSASGVITQAFSALPWALLTKAVTDLANAAEGSNPGLEWSQRTSYCKNLNTTEQLQFQFDKDVYTNVQCVFPLSQVYEVLVLLWVVYFFAAVYLDSIIPDGQGVSKKPWYILTPGYWFPSRVNAATTLNKVEGSLARNPPPPMEGQEDEDVAAEKAKMQALMAHRTGKAGALAASIPGTQNAVELYALQKRFGSRGKPFFAIKNSWFAIEENQLFCLLGPNGAGKSTTINVLTGVLPPTAGDALVYGESITSDGGMGAIRSIMGVCPQFDVLWAELSGKEHLEIYAQIKGIAPRQVQAEAAELLERVKLTYAGKMRSSSYSGGMKRRLSVAIALLGNPRIVYLDEPTTGMDPISRRYVWDIIEEAKKGRAIVLTTHSMEEADILGDRIGIMAGGRLRCLGSSIRLKQKFGAGYQVAVSVQPRNSQANLQKLAQLSEAVKDLFRQRLGVEATDETKAYISFLVERSKEPQLMDFLQDLEQNSQQLGITDIQISLTSLEEVFLAIARKAEMDAATATGKAGVSWTLPDGREVKLPIGMEAVRDPQNDVIYSVRWVQDDTGKLVVMDVTPLGADAPVPSGPVVEMEMSIQQRKKGCCAC